MQFNILAAASLFAMVSASPVTRALAPHAAFNLMVLRSGSEVHFSYFQAALGNIFLHLPGKTPNCGGNFNGNAIFTLTDAGELYLYTDNPPQELYTVRSWMGQGVFGYTTGVQPAPANAERTGWVLDSSNDLTLDGAGFIACPNSIDDSWSVWVDAGVSNPAGNSDCVGITVRAVEVAEPTKCMYS